MSTPTIERIADALHAEWADVGLDDVARGRIADGALSGRPQRRRRLVLAPVGIAFVAAVAVVVASSSFESGPRAGEVRERAAVAVDPGQDVIHYVTTVRQSSTGTPTEASALVREIEVWEYPARGRSRTLVRDSGRVTTEIVTDPDGTVFWSEGRGPERLTPPPQRGKAPPAAVPPFSATSIDEIHAALPGSKVSGPFRDGATGRDVYEIEATPPPDPDALGTRRLNYRVDAGTFAPVRLVSTLLDAPPELVSPRPGDTVTTDFTTFERLAPDEAAPRLRPSRRSRRR